MKAVKRIFDFYLNSSIHVALAVCALVGVTSLEFELVLADGLWFFVFFGTVTGYNFVKYAKIAGLTYHGLTDMLKGIQLFSLVSFILLLYFAFQLPITTLVWVGVFALFTFFYAVPIPFSKNLRTLSGIKVFIVALVWAGATVIVPVTSVENTLFSDAWISFVQRLFIVIALTVPFEIRDLKYDASLLKTLPQQFGLRKVKFLGILLLVLAFVLEGFKDELRLTYFSSLFIALLLTAFALLISREKQRPYFASFFVESIPIVWMGVLYLFEHFLP